MKNNNYINNHSNNHGNYKPLPFDTIKAATLGNSDAMSAVTRHYGGYIASLAVRPIRDEDGNERYAVDESICRELEAKLAEAVLKFRTT